MNRSIRQSVIDGTKWITISTIVDASVQVLRLAILARFLNKSDFGIVAIISVVLGLTTTFGDLGFTIGIMSKKEVTHNEFSSLFWGQFFLFTLLYVILSVVSPLVASFYNEPLIKRLIPISLLSLIFWGVGKLYDTLLQKEMCFKTLAVRSIVSSFIALLSAYIFCVLNFGIYSLILSTLSYTICNNVWNFISGQKYSKLHFHFSLAEVKPFFKIGIFKTGTSIVDYFSSKLDVLIIGRILGMETLGLYNIAKELMTRITSIIQNINSKVSMPALSKVQDDLRQLRNYYCRLTNISIFILIPVCVFVILFPNEIIVVLYGSKYFAAKTVLQLFAALSIVNSIESSEGILTSSLGRADLDFWWTLIRISIYLPVILVTAHISATMVVVGQIIIGVLGFFYVWRYIIFKLIKLGIAEYARSFLRELCSGLIVLASLYFIVGKNVFKLHNSIMIFFVEVSLFFLFYTLVLFLLDKKNIRFILSLFISR